MRPALHIGLRFTVSRKRSLLFSLLGVIFGVAFFICTQAQTQGFQEYFIKTILGTSGAIVISDRFQERYTSFNTSSGSTMLGGQQRRKYYEGITDADELMRGATCKAMSSISTGSTSTSTSGRPRWASRLSPARSRTTASVPTA